MSTEAVFVITLGRKLSFHREVDIIAMRPLAFVIFLENICHKFPELLSRSVVRNIDEDIELNPAADLMEFLYQASERVYSTTSD